LKTFNKTADIRQQEEDSKKKKERFLGKGKIFTCCQIGALPSTVGRGTRGKRALFGKGKEGNNQRDDCTKPIDESLGDTPVEKDKRYERVVKGWEMEEIKSPKCNYCHHS